MKILDTLAEIVLALCLVAAVILLVTLASAPAHGQAPAPAPQPQPLPPAPTVVIVQEPWRPLWWLFRPPVYVAPAQPPGVVIDVHVHPRGR